MLYANHQLNKYNRTEILQFIKTLQDKGGNSWGSILSLDTVPISLIF